MLGSDSEEMSPMAKNSSRHSASDDEVDDFTKKRLPRDEDFVAPKRIESQKRK